MSPSRQLAQQGSQAVAPLPEDQPRPLDPPQRSRQLRGWRTVKQLTAELQFPSEDACRAWLRRQQIVSVRRGRIILVDSLDVAAALRGAR